MSPVAHSLAGATVAILALRRSASVRDRRRALVLAVVLGNLPDVDFAPVVLGADQRRVHRTWSHSLAAAGVVTLAGAAAGAAGLVAGGAGRAAALAGGAFASHLVLDLLCRDDLPPVGVQLGWPVWARFVPPLPLMPSIDPDGVVHGDLLPTALVGATEALVLGAVLAGTVLLRGRHGAHSRHDGHACGRQGPEMAPSSGSFTSSGGAP